LEKQQSGAYSAACKFSMLDELFGESIYKPLTEEEVRKLVLEHPEITTRT
jgi:hypothetical protein